MPCAEFDVWHLFIAVFMVEREPAASCACSLAAKLEAAASAALLSTVCAECDEWSFGNLVVTVVQHSQLYLQTHLRVLQFRDRFQIYLTKKQ